MNLSLMNSSLMNSNLIVDKSFLERWNHYLHIDYVDPQKSWKNAEFSFIIELLNKYIFPSIDSQNLKILDAGCGDGYLIYLLNNLGKDTFGITYKEGEKEYARINDIKTSERISIGDLHNLPYLDNTFDICISRQSLEHCLSPVVALWEMHRILKINGFLLLHVPNNIFGEEDGTNPTHHYAFTPKQWINLAELNGFESIQNGVDSQFGGFYIIAKRKNSIPFIR